MKYSYMFSSYPNNRRVKTLEIKISERLKRKLNWILISFYRQLENLPWVL